MAHPFAAVKLIKVHGSLQAPVVVAIWCLVGMGLGFAAWTPGFTPALAMALPVLWFLAPNRLSAWALTSCYHLILLRFLPEFATRWFDSAPVGLMLWLATGLLCGLGWAVAWTSRTAAPVVLLSWTAALLVTLLPPIGMILPGHPFVGVGYLLPGLGWVGLVFYVLAAGGLLVFLRSIVPSRWPERIWSIRWATVLIVIAFLATAGDKPVPSLARVVGKVGALNTHWGGFPGRDSLEVMNRISKVGRAARNLAGGEGGIDTVIFPESVLGIYDPSLYPVLDLEVLADTQAAGQTIVIGAEIPIGQGVLQKSALVFRPDGTSSYVVARQTVPFAEWAPWRKQGSYEVDWLANSVTDIGGGIKARIVFCYEEYIPMMHLLSEAREEHQMVVVLANLWAAENPYANHVQHAHSEGMTRLFRRPMVRAVNFPSKPKDGA